MFQGCVCLCSCIYVSMHVCLVCVSVFGHVTDLRPPPSAPPCLSTPAQRSSGPLGSGGLREGWSRTAWTPCGPISSRRHPEAAFIVDAAVSRADSGTECFCCAGKMEPNQLFGWIWSPSTSCSCALMAPRPCGGHTATWRPLRPARPGDPDALLEVGS